MAKYQRVAVPNGWEQVRADDWKLLKGRKEEGGSDLYQDEKGWQWLVGEDGIARLSGVYGKR